MSKVLTQKWFIVIQAVRNNINRNTITQQLYSWTVPVNIADHSMQVSEWDALI